MLARVLLRCPWRFQKTGCSRWSGMKRSRVGLHPDEDDSRTLIDNAASRGNHDQGQEADRSGRSESVLYCTWLRGVRRGIPGRTLALSAERQASTEKEQALCLRNRE